MARAKTDAAEAKFEPKEVAGVKIEIKEGWEHLVHALVEKGPRYNPTTGARISKPYVHTTDPKQWDLTKDYFPRIGITVHDVYIPG